MKMKNVVDIGLYENKREDELASKSIKELKAENKELAELKNRMLLAEKQNEKKLNV